MLVCCYVLCVYRGFDVVSEGSFVLVKSGFEIAACLYYIHVTAVWACKTVGARLCVYIEVVWSECDGWEGEGGLWGYRAVVV